VDAGGGVMISTSVFQDQSGEEESNKLAADYVREKMASLLPTPPQITAGRSCRSQSEVGYGDESKATVRPATDDLIVR
jgi:hypothetical protein